MLSAATLSDIEVRIAGLGSTAAGMVASVAKSRLRTAYTPAVSQRVLGAAAGCCNEDLVRWKRHRDRGRAAVRLVQVTAREEAQVRFVREQTEDFGAAGA